MLLLFCPFMKKMEPSMNKVITIPIMCFTLMEEVSSMLGIYFAIFISVVLPLSVFIYALYTRRVFPYVLGVLAFVISQVVLRIPLLNYLDTNSISYNMFSVTKPVIYVILLGFSAGIFEEVARFIAMRFVMKRHDWKAGLLFGVGHGGIEAVLFLGLHAVIQLFTQTIFVDGEAYALGATERFFAILLHIGLSIIVLQSVVTKRIRYFVIAVVLHGVIDSFVGLVPMIISGQPATWILEGLLVVMSISVIVYSIQLKRKGVL